MPETDFEKERRLLRELEGKNIANYKVLLTALIRTTMENVRTIVILSAAGIALTLIVSIFCGCQGGLKVLLVAGAFVGFFLSMVFSLGVLERNAQYLTQSLKSGSEKALDIESCSQGVKKLFFLGCLCLIALGLVTLWGPRWKHHGKGKPGCPLMGQMTAKSSETDTAAAMVSDTKNDLYTSQKLDANGVPTAPASSLAENSKAAVSAAASQSKDPLKTVSATPTAAAPVGKSQGNGGNFKGGTNW